MATLFLEPGGDSTYNVALTTAGGFWTTIGATPAVVTDHVHGSHIKSIQYRAGNADYVQTGAILSDTGGRFSFWIYIVAYPNVTADFAVIGTGAADVVRFKIGTTGQLSITALAAQVGTGSTLALNTWYRISFAYTFTSTTVNEMRLYLNGVLDITSTNFSMTRVGASVFRIGNDFANATEDFRSSDHYVDNSSSLTDTGTIWVTAKIPIANGTTNGFTTQIGSGGSGVGTGHSPQVNERPLSTTNGWSMVGAGSAITEEYNVQTKSAGDIDISTATIVDWLGWLYISSLSGETGNIILGGASVAQAITSTNTLYTAIKGSTTYPAGTGTDIGFQTTTALTTVSLYECGIIVAYTPAVPSTSFPTKLLLMGVGK